MKLNVFVIKLLLAENEMKIADLARKLECSQNNIGCILRRGTCSVKTAGKIAHALGVSVGNIVIQE